jgi:hypothetical protein
MAILRLWIPENTLRELYSIHVSGHNLSILNNALPDSGFDLLISTTVSFQPSEEVVDLVLLGNKILYI